MKVYHVKRTLFTGQTGKFPQISIRGNKYQMALHEIDSNTTWVEPMPNRTEQAMIVARECVVKRMLATGLDPIYQILDNKASAKYKEAITKSGMTYQLVPPDNHRQNIAEKAIQFWKDHFLAVLSRAATAFPLHLWCHAVPQVERQLFLLLQSNVNPKIFHRHTSAVLITTPLSLSCP